MISLGLALTEISSAAALITQRWLLGHVDVASWSSSDCYLCDISQEAVLFIDHWSAVAVVNDHEQPDEFASWCGYGSRSRFCLTKSLAMAMLNWLYRWPMDVPDQSGFWLIFANTGLAASNCAPCLASCGEGFAIRCGFCRAHIALRGLLG